MQTKDRAPNISNTLVKLIRKRRRLTAQEGSTVISPEVGDMVVMDQEDKDRLYQCTSYNLDTYASVVTNKDITSKIARRIRMRHLTHTMEKVCPRSICGKEIWVSVRRNSSRTSRRISGRSSKRSKSSN
jgi:hypothetical protein